MYRIELRDTDFNLLEVLDKEFLDLSWSYSRIGGCGEFNFKLPRKLYEEKSISGDFNIRIYRRAGIGNFDLRYQGLVENKYPSIRGNSESIEVAGHGYSAQLSRIYINETYTSQEISVIVKDILDTYVVPNTDIAYSAGDVPATSFTPDKFDFNTDVASALQTLADTVGNIEWGVDHDRNFFFKPRSSDVGFRYHRENNIINYSEDLSFKDIINRLIVQGAEAGGTYYTKQFDDTISQMKYNIRTKVIQNSSISTDAVATQYATAVFAEYDDVSRKATCELINVESFIEGTLPMPLVEIIMKDITYGTRKYGEFLYSGLVDRQINRVNYNYNNKGILKIGLELGQLRPTIAEELAQLDYKLEQIRSANL